MTMITPSFGAFFLEIFNVKKLLFAIPLVVPFYAAQPAMTCFICPINIYQEKVMV